jgi:Cu2+-exporting ATPase
MKDMNAPLTEACWHCGGPAPNETPWHATIDGLRRPMCCPGCAAAAEAIAEAGLGGYYGSRTAYAARPDDAGPEALALYDERMPDGDGVFTVEGIRCAACVWLIEHRIAALPGVSEVLLNVATERLRVRWDPDACGPRAILQALRTIGYAAYPYDASRHAAQLERARQRLFRRLFVAGLAMMQVMMYAFPVYMAGDAIDPDIMDTDMRALMGWASLLLTLPAVTYSAWPILRGAWLDLHRGLPGMDVPAALGIIAAFSGSAASLVRGSGALYFDSITMFVFLLLGSRYLELNARRKAAATLERLATWPWWRPARPRRPTASSSKARPRPTWPCSPAKAVRAAWGRATRCRAVPSTWRSPWCCA